MKKGITLIELMIYVAIVSLILAVALGSSGGCSVSDGTRKGTLTKFSSKGRIWTTYEGELVMGGFKSDGEGKIQANVWEFSVHTDNPDKDAIVATLNEAIEHDYPVAIKYHQSMFVGPWNGSTAYDVRSVIAVTNSASKKE